jgi:hypothetical protein
MRSILHTVSHSIILMHKTGTTTHYFIYEETEATSDHIATVTGI